MRKSLIIPILFFTLACEGRRPEAKVSVAEEHMTLSSSAFNNGDRVPVAFTADGADRSPPLIWNHVPANTRSLVVIMDDPDAPMGTWDHWVVFNLPAEARGLAEGGDLPAGAREGTNSWGRTGYGGPAPPPGKPHRYVFQLYALREPLELAPGADKVAVQAAMAGKVLAEARLRGTYGR